MKNIGIIEFLEWAFNDELPKGGGKDGIGSVRSAWGRIMAWSELMTTVYQGAGTMEYFDRGGEPHPDAVLAGRAVASLAEVILDLPLDWNPLPETKMTPAAHAAIQQAIHLVRGDHKDGVALRLLPVSIVVRCAVLKRAPDYALNIEVKERMVMNGGKPAWFIKRKGRDSFGNAVDFEMDGFDPKTGHPKPGAYRKWEMPSEIISDLAGRAEWQLWRAALDLVFEDLNGRLADHALTPCDMPLEPWVEGMPKRKEPRIMPDLRKGKQSLSSNKSNPYQIVGHNPLRPATT